MVKLQTVQSLNLHAPLTKIQLSLGDFSIFVEFEHTSTKSPISDKVAWHEQFYRVSIILW